MKGIRKESDIFFKDLSRSIDKLKSRSVDNLREIIRRNKRNWEKYYNQDLVPQGMPGSVRNQMQRLILPLLKGLNTVPATPKNGYNGLNFGKTSNPQQYQPVNDQTPPPPSQPILETPPPAPPAQYVPDLDDIRHDNPVFMETQAVINLPKNKIAVYYLQTLQKAKFNVTVEQSEFFTEIVMENRNMKLKTKYKMGSSMNFSVAKFYEKLKGESPIMVLCEAENGHIFGGVSYSPMDNLKNIHEKNFIFSLSHMVRHDRKVFEEDSRVYEKDQSQFGPVFGEKDLLIGDNCGKEKTCESYFGDGFDYQGTKPDTYLGGAPKFSLRNIYIFKLKG